MPTPLLDRAQADLAYIDQRLAQEPIAWLGTTRPDGRPHNVPVWFGWRDPEIVVFTPSRSQKVRNLAATPACVVTLDSADGGNDIVIVEGRGRVATAAEISPMDEAFASKYRSRMTQTFPDWRATFDQPLLIVVERIVAWSKPGGETRFRVVTGQRAS